VRVELPGSTTSRCAAISAREAFRLSFWLRQNEHMSMQADSLRTSIAPHSRLRSVARTGITQESLKTRNLIPNDDVRQNGSPVLLPATPTGVFAMSSLTRALALCFLLVACAVPSFAQAHTVNVFCCAFQDPANGGSNQTIIPVGTTVQWVRTDFFPHTVTNGTGPTDPIAGTIFNGNLAGAATMFSFTFNTVGTFPYFCTFHSVQNMVGTVFVLPAATSTSVGTGCNSSAGTLVLGTNSLPKVGNATFGFVLSGGPSGAQGFLFLSGAIAATPLAVTPTCLAYLDLVSLQAFMAAGLTPTGPQLLSGAGSTTFTFNIPLIPSLGGATVSGQGLVFDGLAPGGLALSNAVTIVVGA